MAEGKSNQIWKEWCQKKKPIIIVLESSAAITSECSLDQVENHHLRELIELGSTYNSIIS